MKKITCIMLFVAALIAVVSRPIGTTATSESTTITGAATATFAGGAALEAVALKGLEFGTGVFIEPDGTATGVYSAVLTGKSLLGQSQQITLVGNVLHGEVAPDGRVHFNGIATLNLGDGTPSLSRIPFTVSTTGDSVTLEIGSTVLPVVQLTSGNIRIN